MEVTVLTYTVFVLLKYAYILDATYATQEKYNKLFFEQNLKFKHVQLKVISTVNKLAALRENDIDIAINVYQSKKSTITQSDSSEVDIDLSIFSEEFKSCAHTVFDISEYKKFSNETVHIPPHKRLFDKSNYLIKDNELYVCKDILTNNTEEKKLASTNISASLVCSGISLVCIILHITLCIVLKKMRNLPGYCLMSLCIALICAYLCIFAQFKISNDKGCTALGMFLLYFLLSSFFWMNIIAYDVWLSIKMAISDFRTTSDRRFAVRFTAYSLYAWGCPVIVVILSVIIHHSTEDSNFKLIFDLRNCWFSKKEPATLYFITPAAILLGINIAFFVSSFHMISKSQSQIERVSDMQHRFIMCMKLASIMGFMWVFGFIALITNVYWMWTLYEISASLQGVFIFLSFMPARTIGNMCKEALERCRK